MRYHISVCLCALAAACTPAEDEQGTPAQSATEDAAIEATATAETPGEFTETAWRIIAEDGARYTTYLDRDGGYRDLRNGDPWQTGQWTFNATGDERLCLTPEDENGVERCWKPEAMQDETMFATGPGDRRIELERVDYQLPESEDGEDG